MINNLAFKKKGETSIYNSFFNKKDAAKSNYDIVDSTYRFEGGQNGHR